MILGNYVGIIYRITGKRMEATILYLGYCPHPATVYVNEGSY